MPHIDAMKTRVVPVHVVLLRVVLVLNSRIIASDHIDEDLRTGDYAHRCSTGRIGDTEEDGATCRVAVCFSGHVRSFVYPVVYVSARRNLIEAIDAQGCQVDVFAYATLLDVVPSFKTVSWLVVSLQVALSAVVAVDL